MKHIYLFSMLFFYAMHLSGQSCTKFEDTTLSYEFLSSQVDYGDPFYEHNNLTFRAKFNQVVGYDEGSVNIDNSADVGYDDDNPNYIENILFQGDAITQIDFNQESSSNLMITFDVNYMLRPNAVNPFYINESNHDLLPDSTSWTLDSLTAGFSVAITGAIHTIALEGFEIGIDNLCVQELNSAVDFIEFDNSSFTVYPNPTDELLYLETELKLNKIEIFESASGRKVYSGSSDSKIIDMSRLQNGLYFIKSYSDDKMFISRVLKIAIH